MRDIKHRRIVFKYLLALNAPSWHQGTVEGEGDLLANSFNFSSPVSHCLQVTFQEDGHRVGASEMLHRRTKRGKTI